MIAHKRFTVPAILALLFAVAACDGDMVNMAKNQAVMQKCQDLKPKIEKVSDSSQQAALKKLVEDCYVFASEGQIGIMQYSQFEVQFETVIKDGVADDVEIQVLRKMLTDS